MTPDPKNPIECLRHYTAERELIWRQRAAGLPAPWTKDEILQTYSFTNNDRERDRVTIWIRENWRDPHRDDPDLFFAMAIARLVNWPPTLKEIGFPVPWQPDHFLAVMADRKASGELQYGSAYVIPAGSAGGTKAENQVDEIFDPMWADREKLRPRPGPLQIWFNTIGRCHGIGHGFLAGQIVADMKHAPPLDQAPDRETFVISGPGSRKGLNYALGRAADSSWTEPSWQAEFRTLWAKVGPQIEASGVPHLDAQNRQNIMCEFSKYFGALVGASKPKRKFLKGRGAPAVEGAPRSNEAA